MMIKKLGKKKLITIGAVTVIAIGGLVVGVKVNADKKYQENVSQALTEISKDSKELGSLESELLSYYDNSSKEFLVREIPAVDVETFVNKVAKFSKNDYTFDVNSEELDDKVFVISHDTVKIEKEAKELAAKLEMQDYVNSLFQKEKAINGPMIKKELTIVDDLDSSKLEKLDDNTLLSTEFFKAIKDIAGNAKAQLDQIKKATEQVNKLFKDNKVIDKIDDKVLKAGQEEVKKIKNEKARKGQEARLKQVTDEVAKRKKAEEKAKAEKTASEIGGKVVDDGKGNLKVVDSSGVELTQSGNGETATWTPPAESNTNSTGGNANSNWNPPATNNNNGGGQTTPPSGNNGGGSTGGGQTPPSGNNGGGQVTPPVTPPPAEVTLVSGTIGNGGIFGSYAEAVNWAIARSNDNDMNGTGSSSYSVSTLVYSDGSIKYSPNFVAG